MAELILPFMFVPTSWKLVWRGAGLVAAVLIIGALGQPNAAEKAKKKSAKTGPGPQHVQAPEAIFADHQLFRIQIDIPEKGMESLRNYRWQGWNGTQEKRASVKATVREGTNVFRDVAIHMKGAAGSFKSIDDQPALTLNFDKNVKGQTFHGLERFSLNNSAQDRSLLNEQITREMFAAAGVPVPRATHAKVQLNGRDLGVYVLVEAFNKQFLARHFKNPNGNLYDGGFLKDVTDELEKSSGPNPNDRSDLRRLADAANEPNATNRLARLSKVLDLDRFISYLALDVLTCDWDGYALNKNNYRIYHDPDSDKIVFMPHGLDQMFGVMRVGTDMPVFPRMQGLVGRALMQTLEGRQRYRERVSQLMTNVYKVESITNRVWQLTAQLRPLLAEGDHSQVSSQQQEAEAFCTRIVERAKSIREQLAAPDKALKFDTAGKAVLPEWQPRPDHGKPVLDEETVGGRKVLHVSAKNGSCVGVWFTHVRLEPGKYRLEGKVKSQGVVPDPGDRRAGAGVRTADRRPNQKLTGDAPWTELGIDFEIGGGDPGAFGFMGPIQDELPDVELLCELRAAKGEAWFDRDSLRLVRR